MKIIEGYFEPHSASHGFPAVTAVSFSDLVEGETGGCSGPLVSCCLLLKSLNVVKTFPDRQDFLLALFNGLSSTVSHPRIINKEVNWACLGCVCENVCPYLSPVLQPLSSGGFYSLIHQALRPYCKGDRNTV